MEDAVMTNSISSARLKKIVKYELNDSMLKQRLSKLGTPPLDTLLREAGVVLEERLRSASGVKEDGTKLADEALAPEKKRVILSLHPGEQDGFRNLYKGALQAIRNPVMHKLLDFSVERTIMLLRLVDSLLYLLPGSDPADESAGVFLKTVKKYKITSEEAMKHVLAVMQDAASGSGHILMGYESVTANLYWLDTNGHKRRFFVLNAKTGNARVWTDYLRKHGYNELADKLENVAVVWLPSLKGKKSAAIKVLDKNVGSISNLIKSLVHVFDSITADI